MEADRIPGLYFTGDRTFLHLAQEIKDNIYGFCTGEFQFTYREYPNELCTKALLDKTLDLNMLLVSKQVQEEYEKEFNRLDSNKSFERSLTFRFQTLEEVLCPYEGEEDYELLQREETSRTRLVMDMADLFNRINTQHLTTVTSLHLEFYEAACWSSHAADLLEYLAELFELLPRLETFHIRLIVPNWMLKAPKEVDINCLDAVLTDLQQFTKHVETRRFTVERHSFPDILKAAEPALSEPKFDITGRHKSQAPGLATRHVQYELTTGLENVGSKPYLRTNEFVEVPCARTLRELLEKCPSWRGWVIHRRGLSKYT